MLIPALTGQQSEGWMSLDREAVIGVDGSVLGEVCVTPPVLLRRIAQRGCVALRDISVRDLLQVFARAADVFETGSPDGLSPEAFVRKVTLNSGLPISVSRERTLGLFPDAMRSMARVLAVQSPAGLEVFDTHVYERQGLRIGFVPRGRNVGFAMPGNHPSTHGLWLSALVMKMPVVVRPSADDLFTPFRLVRSLLAAGLPADAATFLPGGHDLVDAMVESCPLSVVFGGEIVAARYAGNRRVRLHGPGRSKVIVPADADLAEAARLIVRQVTDDAGRGCNNTSAVIVEGDAGPLAVAVAEMLDTMRLQSPLAPGALLGAVRPPMMAALTALIDSHLDRRAHIITPTDGSRSVVIEGMTVVRPMLVTVPSAGHPLFGLELPFPFVVFASATRADCIVAARQSLAVVVAGNDSGLINQLLFEPTISKVFLGNQTTGATFDPAEPHEGFLLDFLYEKKALSSVLV